MEHPQIIGFDTMIEPLVAALNRLAAAQERIADEQEKQSASIVEILDALGGIREECNHISYHCAG